MSTADRIRTENLDRLRVALQRQGEKVNSRTTEAKLHAHVERIMGKPLPTHISERNKVLNKFMERGVAWDLPVVPWKPLSKAYTDGLRRHQELCELVR